MQATIAVRVEGVGGSVKNRMESGLEGRWERVPYLCLEESGEAIRLVPSPIRRPLNLKGQYLD